MRLFNDTKIYIACPGSAHSGGPELLHQLCSFLLQYGLDAQMFYTSGNFYNPVNPVLRKYHLPYVFKIEDNPHNILVLYEAIGTRYFEYKCVQKIFWWLSVNVYISSFRNIISSVLSNPLAETMPKIFYFQPEEKDIDHWVQSEYARQFVMLNGVHEKNIYVVEDYLSQAFLSKAEHINLNLKGNFVLFNPKKGFDVTQKLMQLAPDIQWFPIQNMTPEKVQEALSKAKVYIDFGSHPGKDRIPREAAISGCVVITGKQGAAANNIDINIPPEFKFDQTDKDFPKIIEKIRRVFENFDEEYFKQKSYREKILDDKRRFESQVAEIFGINRNKKIPTAALLQGYSPKTYYFLKYFSPNNFSLIPKFIVDDRLGDNPNVSGDFLTRINNHNYFEVGTQPGGGDENTFRFYGRRKIFILGRTHKKICFTNAG